MISAAGRETPGPVDPLGNYAGVLPPVGGVGPDAWLRNVTADADGAFLCARAVLPHL